MIKVKVIKKGVSTENFREQVWGTCLFTENPGCLDYDWLVVYDELPRKTVGTVCRGVESLKCSPRHTILVTCEPTSIKIYGTSYTDQFEYILTTQPPEVIHHRHFQYGRGTLLPLYDKSWDAIKKQTQFSKTAILSTVCSSKQQTHTRHLSRYQLTAYLSNTIPELDWFGKGVNPVDKKYLALDAYKYHLAVENQIQPYHWTEKLTDSLLAGCLTFYAGDPAITQIFPEQAIIPVPIDDMAETARIIREAIDTNQYEKRLPSIMEARNFIIEKYNFYAQIVSLIEQYHDHSPALAGAILRGRHSLRRNPYKAIKSCAQSLHYKLFMKRKIEL